VDLRLHAVAGACGGPTSTGRSSGGSLQVTLDRSFLRTRTLTGRGRLAEVLLQHPGAAITLTAVSTVSCGPDASRRASRG